MRRRGWRFAVAAATCVLSVAALARSARADDAADKRIAWWRDAKFGLFMHFGVYSILGRGEWVQWNEQIPTDEYAKLAGRFNPERFDAGAWAKVAKDAGVRYTVLTSRHHDGFALFDDPQSDFTSVKSAFGRDVVAEYVRAVRDAGLHVGLYYSPLDWRYPGFFFPDLYRDSASTMREQYHRQMRELLTNYGKLDVLWFDGGGADWLGFHGVTFGGPSGWHARPKGVPYTGGFSWGDDEVYAMIRRLQPDAISNDRIDAPEDFHSREGDGSLGDFDSAKPWELCTTLAGAWGYQANAKVKPLDRCIQLLVCAVGRDGNLLLNVGPRPDGVIDPPQVARLREIGDWLRANGESIYGTRGGPFLPGPFGVSTHRGRTIYVHVLHPPTAVGGDPATATLALPPIGAKVLRCGQLGGSRASCEQTDAGITLTFTPDPAKLDAIVTLELDRDVAGIAPISTTRPSK